MSENQEIETQLKNVSEAKQYEEQIQEIINLIEDEYLHEGRYQQAFEQFKLIEIKEIREDKRILSIEARICLYDDPMRSEQILQQLFEEDPLFFRNTFEYITLLQDSYESKAIEVQKKILDIIKEQEHLDLERSEDGYYLACKGLAIKSKNTMIQARKYLEKAIQKMPKPFQKSDLYSQLGNTYLELNQYQQAIPFYKEGLKIQPRNDECLNNISYCYLEMDQLQNAMIYGELALQNYPYNSTILCNLAIIYEELNDFDKAEKAYIDLFKNKSIGSIQHSNYAQFLFEHRSQDKQKVLLIFQNLTKGFVYDKTSENSIFEVFQEFIYHPDKFTKVMYSYKPILSYFDFIEQIREQSPHLLPFLNSKIIKKLSQLEVELNDEEFEDIDDDESIEESEGEEEIIEEEEQGVGQEKMEQEDEQNKIKKDANQDNQSMKRDLFKAQNEIDNSENIIIHNPYQDETQNKQLLVSQKVLFFGLMRDLIILKQKENQTLLKILAYNKFVKEQLHFQSDVQFWDLYFV